jgi:NAD(P)-dependent dehydrogenase (short-subunit alcohol dehydrogenase family)
LTNILAFNQIIIGCRDLTKAENAIKDIEEKNPKADITALKLDLSSLQSVRQFSKSVAEKVSTIDILINNGAVAMCPQLQSEDGFELQFATNHLGIKLSLNSLFY